jgi:cellulose synthase/poly-beta-1,6-N-acetylglucosamine synthase-like glycosyltransferase
MPARLILDIILLLVTIAISAGLAYLYLLLIAGKPRATRPAANAGEPPLGFAIAIPAHNEAGVIGATVGQLRKLAYRADRFDVHVVADHCRDDTAAVAAAAGAEVHVRSDAPAGRKGYAVDWLIRRLLADPRRYDAIAVFDADSQVDARFLAEISPYLAAGAAVVQGRHVIANPGASRFAALADADMRLNNRIRNQAKENLGLSARLMGDAMVFRRAVLAQRPWVGAESLTEDRDYGIYLVTQGVRIRFAPNAISVGQAVARWGDATPQRLRWYGGAFELQRRYLPILWRLARRGNGDALDKLLELALPPFSLLALGSAALLLLQLLLSLATPWPPALRVTAAALLLLAFVFPFAGLIATGAPPAAYRAMLAGPFYVLWRAGISIWVRLRYRSVAWVRTRRTGDPEK